MGPSGPSDTFLRPVGARRRELDLRISDLPDALTAVPASTWPYGRVIAVEEDPTATQQDSHAVRRNVEQTMQVLNDLGIVVDEWPSNGTR
jgi:phytoene dehydrogenase-like protein